MKRKIIDFFAGRAGLQKYFELLFTAGMYGMNYNNGGNFKKSGELYAARYVNQNTTGMKRLLFLTSAPTKGFMPSNSCTHL